VHCGGIFIRRGEIEWLWYKKGMLCKVCNAILFLHYAILAIHNCILVCTRAILFCTIAILFVHNGILLCTRAILVCTRAIIFLHNAKKVLAKSFLFDIVCKSFPFRTLLVSSKLTFYGYFRDLFSR
jgi:hypothetical protein